MSIEHSPVLVLNKSWYPIDSRSLKKAFKAVVAERAVFLDTEAYMQHNITSWSHLPVLEGQSSLGFSFGKMRIPEVMLLSKFNRVPRRDVVFCRRNIWRRDKRRCQYCGCMPHPDDVTIDHIVPRFKGGQSTFPNCVLACTKCNLKKGHKSLRECGMRLQRMKKLSTGEWTTQYYDTPIRPQWNPLYTLRRKTFPLSWKAFLKNFDETMYWEVELEK